MAQLPPRVPSFPSHNRSPAQAPPSWVDEFLDFTSARRGNHRRSASDGVAYLESPLIGNSGDAAFERLDDDQLLSMFSDDDKQLDLPPAAKPEPPEPDTECDPNTTSIDPKRVKRILANRQSAQRSRVRKLQYISELERSVTTLQTEVSALSPRVAFLDHQRLILNVDNSALKQRIAALAQDKIFKDAHQEALKKEIERLRQIYTQQNNNMNKVTNSDAAGGQSPAPASDGMAFTPEKQLITS